MLPQFKHFLGILVIVTGLAMFGSIAQGQVQLPPYVKPQFLDQNGRTLSNGCLFTYISGTSTPLVTYTDFTMSTPNPNPIVLDGSGRPPRDTDIWLGSGSYRFKLVSQGGVNCVSGVQVFVEDGITSSFGTIFAGNNTWTGTQTFNGPVIDNGSVTMNAGFTSPGPANLTGGGTLGGSFGGNPMYSGTPVFTNGIVVDGTATFNGQLASTVTTGTSPFIIASTTQVPNLNASLLEGQNWEIPGRIGLTTPNTGAFTTLSSASLRIAASSTVTGIQGTDPNLLSAGTIAGGSGNTLCTDTVGGATTSGCPTSGFSQIESDISTNTTCPTSTGAGATCTFTILWPVPFLNTTYAVSCTGDTITGNPYIAGLSAKSTTGVTVTVSNGTASSATASTYGDMECIGVHQ